MNCLIIDDNPIARGALKQLVSRENDLRLVAECADSEEAYRQIMQEKTDLLLLDIEMPGMSGLELARSLPSPQPMIIFTTSNTAYAAEAFDLHVVDYLTKPINSFRFMQAVSIARDLFARRQAKPVQTADSFVFFRDGNIIKKLHTDEILFVEAKGDYVRLFTTERMHSVHSTLKSVEEKLPVGQFLKVHRSFVVQVGKIDSIEGTTLLLGSHFVPVADSYRSALNQRLNLL